MIIDSRQRPRSGGAGPFAPRDKESVSFSHANFEPALYTLEQGGLLFLFILNVTTKRWDPRKEMPGQHSPAAGAGVTLWLQALVVGLGWGTGLGTQGVGGPRVRGSCLLQVSERLTPQLSSQAEWARDPRSSYLTRPQSTECFKRKADYMCFLVCLLHVCVPEAAACTLVPGRGK